MSHDFIVLLIDWHTCIFPVSFQYMSVNRLRFNAQCGEMISLQGEES